MWRGGALDRRYVIPPLKRSSQRFDLLLLLLYCFDQRRDELLVSKSLFAIQIVFIGQNPSAKIRALGEVQRILDLLSDQAEVSPLAGHRHKFL